MSKIWASSGIPGLFLALLLVATGISAGYRYNNIQLSCNGGLNILTACKILRVHIEYESYSYIDIFIDVG